MLEMHQNRLLVSQPKQLVWLQRQPLVFQSLEYWRLPVLKIGIRN